MLYKIFINEKQVLETNNFKIVKKIAKRKIEEHGKKNVIVTHKDKIIKFF